MRKEHGQDEGSNSRGRKEERMMEGQRNDKEGSKGGSSRVRRQEGGKEGRGRESKEGEGTQGGRGYVERNGRTRARPGGGK